MAAGVAGENWATTVDLFFFFFLEWRLESSCKHDSFNSLTSRVGAVECIGTYKSMKLKPRVLAGEELARCLSLGGNGRLET